METGTESRNVGNSAAELGSSIPARAGPLRIADATYIEDKADRPKALCQAR